MPTMKMGDETNSVSIDAGQTSSLIWTFSRPGTLYYACHVPGHYAAGMQGQLDVHG
ncbi:plastocyanin/azurin family copper-binding protein [Dyella sedimenti]|uniref:plastocyanin/azurin family copper-binding protein n=1 Tax=Dyella sedimenti TaxID=2919947 RepID=UPI001FA9CC47|nr:plastocyanin/azurin family copper-binding protein [Dyella sedimenti]